MDKYFVPKLGDFGLSSYLNLGDQDNLVLMGTYAYMPPECIQEQKMSTKSDVYSFGVVRYLYNERLSIKCGQFSKVLMELLTGTLADDPYSKPRSLVSVNHQMLSCTIIPVDQSCLWVNTRSRTKHLGLPPVTEGLLYSPGVTLI